MEQIDFEFKRDRDFGEFVQDFVNLLKIVSSHLLRVMLRLLIIPICLMVLLSYYISTQLALNIQPGIGHYESLFINIFAAFLILSAVGLVAFGFAIEYFFLLRDRRTLDFGPKDVWLAFRSNFAKYLRFLPTALVGMLIIAVPTGIVAFLLLFIPFVGSIAMGIFVTMVSVWFICAMMFYREGYFGAIDALVSTFPIIKAKIFLYGSATYTIHFIFQALLGLMILIPTILIGVIGYTTGTLSGEFFGTWYGKISVSIGGSIVTIVTLMYYAISTLSYGIIYETAKEMRYGEDVFQRIQRIGKESDNVD